MCLPESENMPTIFERIPGCKPHLDDPSEKTISESIQIKACVRYFFIFIALQKL